MPPSTNHRIPNFARVREYQAQFESGELDLAAAMERFHLSIQQLSSGAYCTGQRAHDGLPNNFQITSRFDNWLGESVQASAGINRDSLNLAQRTHPLDRVQPPMQEDNYSPAEGHNATGKQAAATARGSRTGAEHIAAGDPGVAGEGTPTYPSAPTAILTGKRAETSRNSHPNPSALKGISAMPPTVAQIPNEAQTQDQNPSAEQTKSRKRPAMVGGS